MRNKVSTNILRKFISISLGLAIIIYLALTNLFIVVTFNNLVQDQSKWHFTPFTSSNELKEISEISDAFRYKAAGFKITDGLGREVEPSSWLKRYIFGSNNLSAGLGWQFFDWILLFLTLIIAISIYPESNY